MAEKKQLTKPGPGEVCPCCERKMPGKTKVDLEVQKAKRLEYNSRPEVQEKRKAYQAKRREQMKAAMELLRAQQAAKAE